MNIKFRAWHKELKIMQEVANINIFHEEVTIESEFGRRWFTEEFVLMQWTGLKDVAGQDAYEGDIVEFALFGSPGFIRSKIIFKEGAFQVTTGDFPYLDSFWGFGACPKQGKIIGNIYENPELLRET